MSPGSTMARVYSAVKTQIMTGVFAPGDRLDPNRMASELAASLTPVREALHRLSGERLIENWQQEGFRVPLVTEATLRDLYSWSMEVTALAARAAKKAGAGGETERETPFAFGELLLEVAARSPNHEHRALLANLNDRSESIRPVEIATIGDADALPALAAAIDAAAWNDVRSLLTAYYRRRLRAVVDIAAILRPRDPA